MPGYSDTKPFVTAVACAQQGDAGNDNVFAMLEGVARINDLDLEADAIFPDLTGSHEDPRWLPLTRRLGCARGQLDAIKLDVKVPK